MEKCWANTLEDCEGKMSREHTVSESLFKGTFVDVKGFSWCKDEEKRIGLASLTKKILCEKHNSALSPLDAAASHAFDVLRNQTKLSNDRGKHPNKKYKKITFSLNATFLERWLLKTLINFSYDGEYFIGPDSTTKGRPCETLVNIAYGIKVPFEDMPGSDPEWHNVYLSKRFKQIRATHGNKISHVVNFNWV